MGADFEGRSHGAGGVPSVAVVVAAFNAAATIDAALASVASQSHTCDHVIVVDDGSGDDTADRAERWAGRLPLTVVRLTSNGGPARARHIAIRDHVTAPLVALLDADDVWLPDHVATLVDKYAQTAGLVSAEPLRWIPGQGLARPGRPIPQGNQRHAILRDNWVFTSVVFSAADYRRVGGFRECLSGAEDWDLWIRMIRSGIVVSGTDHPTILYRLSPGSLSADDHSLAAEINVLERAVAESDSPDDRRVAERSLRRYRCRRQLVRAYACARSARPHAARLAAAVALRGPRAVVLRALAVMVAPRWAVRSRDALKFQPARWLAR